MRETENKEIDGIWYECQMMPATLANKTLVRLVDTLGRPAVAAIAGGFGDQSVDTVANTVSMILTKGLTPEATDEIVMSVLKGVYTPGAENEDLSGNGELHNRENFDRHFRGRIKAMYQVVAWSIQVNYRDFFDVARSSPNIKMWRGRAEKVFSALIATLESGTSLSRETTSTSETSTS